MRILTVRQPWAWAIIHGGKDVENRVRNIAGGYRGPVAIHAAQQVDLAAFSGQSVPLIEAAQRFNAANTDVLKSSPWQTRGVIFGVVDLVGVHKVADDEDGACSPWAEYDALDDVHMVLANPRALDEPIPYRGALGLRKTEFAVVNDYLVAPWDHGPGSCTPYGCEPWCNFEPVARLVATS